jgi:hypothetical protein
VLILATIEQFEMLIFYFIYVLEEKSIMDNDIQAMNQDNFLFLIKAMIFLC